MTNKMKYVEIPFPDGRFKPNKQELFTLLLEAIESFRNSSNTKKGKRLMIPCNLLANHVAFGTMKMNMRLYYEKDNKKIGFLKRKISKILLENGAIKSGNCVVIEPAVIRKLRKDDST